MSQVSWAVKLRPHRNRCEDSDSFIARPSSPLYPLKVRFLCPALLREKINPRLTLRSLPTSRCLFVRQGCRTGAARNVPVSYVNREGSQAGARRIQDEIFGWAVDLSEKSNGNETGISYWLARPADSRVSKA